MIRQQHSSDIGSSTECHNQRRASRTAASGSFIQDLALANGGMEHGTHHMAPSGDLIGCGDHYVLADKKIA